MHVKLLRNQFLRAFAAQFDVRRDGRTDVDCAFHVDLVPHHEHQHRPHFARIVADTVFVIFQHLHHVFLVDQVVDRRCVDQFTRPLVVLVPQPMTGRYREAELRTLCHFLGRMFFTASRRTYLVVPFIVR